MFIKILAENMRKSNFCQGAHAGHQFEHPLKVVLLDLKLPKIDGIEVSDGTEALIQVAEKRSELRVVILTCTCRTWMD